MDETSALRRTGVLAFVKTIGNKEYHVLSPVIGGLAIKLDEHSIIIPVTHLDELADWLKIVANKMGPELERTHKFERGE